MRAPFWCGHFHHNIQSSPLIFKVVPYPAWLCLLRSQTSGSLTERHPQHWARTCESDAFHTQSEVLTFLNYLSCVKWLNSLILGNTCFVLICMCVGEGTHYNICCWNHFKPCLEGIHSPCCMLCTVVTFVVHDFFLCCDFEGRCTAGHGRGLLWNLPFLALTTDFLCSFKSVAVCRNHLPQAAAGQGQKLKPIRPNYSKRKCKRIWFKCKVLN